MINRPRTAFVSVAAVAVSMIMLGSDARAKSKSNTTASSQKYVRFLENLAKAELKTAPSLIRTSNSLERTMNSLESIPNPRPQLARRIASQEKAIYKQELKVFSEIQNNTKALLATQTDLQTLPPQERAQVSSLLTRIQGAVASEKGVATPVR
jgi:hypothetical protein